MAYTFAKEMKRLLEALICFAVSLTTATAEAPLRYSKPFQGMEAGAVSSVILRTKTKNTELKISDKEWTSTLLGTITDKDFPLRSGPMSFSLPGELCSVEFRDESGKALRIVTVYGAWNLLAVRSDGKSVLGSNRHFSETVIRKLEAAQPEYIQKQRETYGKDLSGKYEKEYRDILQSEQAGTEQPATRPKSKPEGSDKPQPEAEGRSR
jgi:hypothetical protein